MNHFVKCDCPLLKFALHSFAGDTLKMGKRSSEHASKNEKLAWGTSARARLGFVGPSTESFLVQEQDQGYPRPKLPELKGDMGR